MKIQQSEKNLTPRHAKEEEKGGDTKKSNYLRKLQVKEINLGGLYR